MNRAKLLGRLQSSLWFIPLMYALLGLVISGVTMFVDQRTDYQLLSMDFIGGPDAALAILGTVAASMVSLLATVLAITMVVVQLAMAQFSPRIVQTFLQDRPSQNAIGLFVATFVVAMLSMRGVQVGEDPVVPGFSVLVVFVLVVVDIVVLVTYIHHIGRSLRVSALIEMVGTNTRSLLDEIYPHTVQLGQDQRSEDPHVVRADHSGVLSLVGHEHLVELATEVDGTIEVIPALGQYVPAGSPLVRLRGVTAADVDLTRLRGALRLSLERTLEQDVAFGLRMLVDMGIKALSESPFADPTTTVQVIDRVHDLMRQLARRELTGRCPLRRDRRRPAPGAFDGLAGLRPVGVRRVAVGRFRLTASKPAPARVARRPHGVCPARPPGRSKRPARAPPRHHRTDGCRPQRP